MKENKETNFTPIEPPQEPAEQESNQKQEVVNTNGDLLTEHYDNSVKMIQDEDAFMLFENQEQVQFHYNLKEEEVRQGLSIFQKKTIYKRNIIYTILLAVIFVMYVLKIISNPRDGLSYFLTILSVAVIGFIWILPFTHRKKIAETVAASKDEFVFTVCEKGLIAGEGETATYIFYENEPVEAIECENMLIVSISKEKIFVLPRRCMEEPQWEQAVNLLKSGLGERMSIYPQPK